jgi:hypothetical protein
VAESGYSAVIAGSGMATFGAIVENVGHWHAAVGVTVTARFFDPAGKLVPLFGAPSRTTAAVTVMPGKRVGVGDQFLGDLRGLAPARMELTVQMSGWWPEHRITGLVTTTWVRLGRDAEDFYYYSFDVDSGLSKPLRNPRVVVIVRDQAKKVIGGLIPPRSLDDWPPGDSLQRVKLTALAMPRAVDHFVTEVFVGYAEIDKRPAYYGES